MCCWTSREWLVRLPLGVGNDWGQEGASGAGEVLFLGLGAVIWMYPLYQVVHSSVYFSVYT